MLFKKITQAEQINFAKNLAVLLKGGVTINEAIESLASQSRPGTMREVLYRLKTRIENGISLASAISEEGDLFGKVFVSMVKAGELSGSLSDNLEFLAVWLERDTRLRKDISGVMLYPKIVFTAVLILGGTLTTFVLPRLVPMFRSLNVDLPLITRIILDISLFSQKNWPYIILGILLTWLFVYLLFRIEKIKFTYHKFLVKAPYVSEFVVGYQLALFSQLMGTLLRSGITIDEALFTAYLGTSNLYYKKALAEIIDRVSKGVSVISVMKDYPEIYPINSISVLAVGENSGTLEESFFKVSDFWTKDISDRTKMLPTIIEPVLLVIIALAVGLIAMSIILPIYKLTGNLGV
jgi:type II secretory pathway component PulF